MKCKILGFGHFFTVIMTSMHSQDLPWVGPEVATTKQPPGLKSSQSCVSWSPQILRFCHFWPPFRHISIVNMTFLHAQDLPWVGPEVATTKQPPGLKSSQSCVSLCKKSADFTFLSFLAPFGHISMVNMTFLHAQDLPRVGPQAATTKQPPGLKSSQSCVSLRKKSADFMFLSFLAPVWAHVHG